MKIKKTQKLNYQKKKLSNYHIKNQITKIKIKKTKIKQKINRVSHPQNKITNNNFSPPVITIHDW